MPKPKVLVLASCAMLLAIGLLWSIQDTGPRYKGRSLARWLDILDRARHENDRETNVQATEAIHVIGTNGLPFALSQLKQEISGSYLEDFRFIGNHVSKYRRNREAQLRRTGWVFYILSSNAAPAVPEVVAIVTNSQNEETIDRAVGALCNIGDASLPQLLTFMSDSNNPACHSTLWWIAARRERFGTDLMLAIPHLAKHATSSPPRLAVAAINALGYLQLDPSTSIDALTKAFASNHKRTRVQALAALTQFQYQPVITSALADPDPAIRHHATNAMLRLRKRSPTRLRERSFFPPSNHVTLQAKAPWHAIVPLLITPEIRSARNGLALPYGCS